MNITFLQKLIKKRGGKILFFAKKVQYKSFFSISSKRIRGKGNRILFNNKSMLFNVSIRIIGNNNVIQVEEGCILERVSIFIKGSNNKIIISKNVQAHHFASWWIEDDGNAIYVGENSCIGDAHLAVTEDGHLVQIGSNCIFAKGIEIRTGDSHSIIDALTERRINYAKSVIIGNHVWIGSSVSILKGAIVPHNSIVATRSVVTKVFCEENTLIAGIPAKVVKQNIGWIGDRI